MEFKVDGICNRQQQIHLRTKEMAVPGKFFVEDGVIKQVCLGRKYESCSTEKDNSKMVLKCTSLFFFLTKK
jgi:hypothetical protein